MIKEINPKIKELFVPYDLVVELNKIGFNESCFGYWSDYGDQEPFLLTCEYDNEKESCSIRRKNFLFSAPTI